MKLGSRRMSLAALIAERGVTMIAQHGAPENPEFEDSDGWMVTLKYKGKKFTVPFYMGRGHNGAAPACDDVLDCLLSDANLGELEKFEDFCSELGYDPDSRRAEQIYHACQRTAIRLHVLLGADYEEFANADR